MLLSVAPLLIHANEIHVQSSSLDYTTFSYYLGVKSATYVKSTEKLSQSIQYTPEVSCAMDWTIAI